MAKSLFLRGGMATLAVASALGWGAAHANPVTATLAATYFEVADNGNPPDFGGSGSPIVALGSALGPNGFPVASGGIADINPTTHEITWWSPALNSAIHQTGTGTISLPFASNMYAPNSTGGNDATFFETAFFTGTFSLASASTVGFNLGSDDDSFIYVDGTLFGQNPGIHGVSTVDFTSPTLAAGSHTIEVFFADREQVGAALSLSLDANTNIVITPPQPPATGVPEPATLALLGSALFGMGAVRRRRR